MLRRLRLRLTRVEESFPVPVTAERFIARAQQQARRSGGGLEAALARLVRDLTDSELDTLGAELEQIVFGSDTAARDKARREVLTAAGYPDWIDVAGREPRDQA